MKNECQFSECRAYRYRLEYREPQMFAPSFPEQPRLVWIGLNPSTADEQNLDPTLRRIAAFSKREGFGGFTMLNLFAFRATKPEDMKSVRDPIGPDNNNVLIQTCRAARKVVCAWGANGSHRWQDVAVLSLLDMFGVETVCLGTTGDGQHPLHPLYQPANAPLVPFSPLACGHAAA